MRPKDLIKTLVFDNGFKEARVLVLDEERNILLSANLSDAYNIYLDYLDVYMIEDWCVDNPYRIAIVLINVIKKQF